MVFELLVNTSYIPSKLVILIKILLTLFQFYRKEIKPGNTVEKVHDTDLTIQL